MHDARGRERPREAEVGLDDVANEGGHRNAAVLDLRVAQVADGRLGVVEAADRGLAERERVPCGDRAREIVRASPSQLLRSTWCER